MVGQQVLAFGKSETSEFIYIGSFGPSGCSRIWGPNIGRSRRDHERSRMPQLPIERTAKTPIILGGCPGWSKSLLAAQVILLVLLCCGSFGAEPIKLVWKTEYLREQAAGHRQVVFGFLACSLSGVCTLSIQQWETNWIGLRLYPLSYSGCCYWVETAAIWNNENKCNDPGNETYLQYCSLVVKGL